MTFTRFNGISFSAIIHVFVTDIINHHGELQLMNLDSLTSSFTVTSCSFVMTSSATFIIIIIIIRQPLCPVVGRRPQHAVSKLPWLVLSSAKSSLRRLAGLPCRLFLSCGLQVVTREVHRSSMRRLICPAQDHFIFLTVLIISMTFVLSLTQMLVFLSLYVMLSMLLSILVCAAASLFCACLVSFHVSASLCNSWQHNMSCTPVSSGIWQCCI